ncbi:MAG: choice-of-anchor D domain-containing protein [Microscillaceae bacterium]|nr:choice-of-anchor D domain-containing protein [Microscillaceae bacterium]MDW8461575.1 choice-of-anchor D domain-containing protein [Cytophagales bacterium]
MQNLYTQSKKKLPKKALLIMLLGAFWAIVATYSTQAQVTLLTQNFNAATGQTPPPGWTNTVGVGSPVGNPSQLWQFGTQRNITGGGFSGNYAMLDSDAYGIGNTQHAVLTSPSFNCSSYSQGIILSFSECWRGGFGSTGILQISTNGGTTWSTIATRGNTDVNGGGGATTGTVTTINITSQAANQSDVRLRWIYIGSWAWWWAIDNVLVEILPNVDLAFVGITNPIASTIFCTGSQNFSVELRNAGLQTIDFTFTPAIVTVNALDPNGSLLSISTTVNTNTLAPGQTRVVSVGSLNLSVEGTYIISANVNMPGDQRPSNNNLAPLVNLTVNSTPTFPLPQSVAPPSTFTGSNPDLGAITAGRWREAVGVSPVPANTEWIGANATQQSSFGQNTIRLNVWSRGSFGLPQLQAWILGPRILVDAQTRLQYDMALTAWNSAGPYSLTLTAGEGVRVMISNNCGGSWTQLAQYGFGSNSGLTNSLQRFSIDIGTINSGQYVGQEIQIGFWLTDDTGGDLNGADIHIANISLLPRDAVTVTPFTANGLATSPLIASSTDRGLVGFAMRADGNNTWQSVVINTSQPVAGRFTNLRLVRSIDNNLATTADNSNVMATITTTATQITISGLTQALTSTNNNYFLVADVDPNVTASTAPIQFTFTHTNVTVATSFVYPFTLTSTNFSFIGILTTFTSLNSTSNGVAPSPLIASTTNQAIYGVAVTALAPTNLTAFTVNTSSTSIGKVNNVRLVSSVDNNYASASDNTTLTATINITPTQIQITGLTGQSLSNTPRHYFIVADVLSTVNETTPALQLSMTQADVTVSVGSVNPFNIAGINYSFATKSINLSGNLNFGDVLIGQTATRTFDIQNTGSAPILVSNISYPQGYTGDFLGIVPPGATRTVNVTFAPVSTTINYDGTITVISDALSGNNTIPVFGKGIARIIALSNEIAFGDVIVGQTATRTLSITNNGNAPLTVSNIIYPTGFSGAFTGTIAPGATQNVTVTFAPTDNIFYQGNITVVSNANNISNLIPVTGRGIAPQGPTTGLERFGKGTLMIYPNPSEGIFNIKVAESLRGAVKVTVYDASGKVVYTTQTDINQDELGLDLSHLSKGNYMIEISNRKGKATERIIKR